MSANRTVTYVDMGLNSVAEYWSQLVVPNIQDFVNEPNPRTAFQAATNVWHLHDWVWHDRNPGQNSGGPAFDQYRSQLTAVCPELRWLRDLTDAGKHRGLGRMPEVVEARPQWKTFGSRLAVRIGTGASRRYVYSLVLGDGSSVDLQNVLATAVSFWIGYLPEHALAAPSFRRLPGT